MRLADTQEVAKILKVSERTIERWAYERTGPPFAHVGKVRRYDLDELEAWVRSKTVDTSLRSTGR